MSFQSRSMRAETRNRTKDIVKRVTASITRTRKWEKKWVVVKDTTMKIYKWVPISESSGHIRGVSKKLRVHLDDEDASRDASSSKMTEDNDNSQDPFGAVRDDENSRSRAVTDFSTLNEDSNAAFSEAGFDSDSNPPFPPHHFADDSTDFSTAFTPSNFPNEDSVDGEPKRPKPM